MRVADYILDYLSRAGVTDIFLLPGGGAMHLNDALASHPDVEGVVCHHEQACAISAEAWGRTAPAGFGVAMVTTGPGATNAVTPVAGAWIESLPLFVVSGQVKRADALAGRKIRQGGVQEVDIISLVTPITKFARTVNDPVSIKACLDEAMFEMTTGRKGPVWLDVPLDVQAAQIDPASLTGWTPPSASADTSRDWIATFKILLEGAERPVLLGGHGIRIAGAADQFRALAEKLGIPCTFTWNAADLLPFDHPLYVGRPGVVAARAPNFAIQNCDLLIAIGCRLDNIITAYNPKGFARAAKKIVVDVDAHELSRHEMTIDLPIEADAKAVIDTLLHENIDYRVPQNWAERCEDWKRRYPASEGRAATSGERMNHYAFCDVLSRSLKPNTNVITGSSGLAVEVFYTTFQNREGQRLFLTSGLGAMGYGVAAAIGACVGSGRKPTYCIESDGSLMMNIQELATLRAQSLPITVVVMNNGGYASIRNTQRNYFDSRFIGTDRESGLLIPDLVAIAQSFGLPAVDVSSEAELETVLQDLPAAGPRLINVHLARDEVLAPKVSALPQKDGSIISMPLEDMSPLLPLVVLQREMIVPLSEQSLRSRA